MMRLVKLFFVMGILGCLVLPICHINKEKMNVRENRTLVKIPKLKKDGWLNENYGKEFELWLGDRFWGRDKFIDARFHLFYKLNSRIENDKAFMDDDGMIFSKEKIRTICFPISEEKFSKIKLNLEFLKKWCQNHHIKLYIFIPPEKEDIFFDKINHFYRNCAKEPISNFVSQIKKEIGIDILYPKDLYHGNHKEFTHTHTDHHWTEYGAWLTYQELSKRIKKDFPNFRMLSESDFDVFYDVRPRLGSFKNLFDRRFYSGTNCNTLRLDKKKCLLTHFYPYYDHKHKERLMVNYGPLPMSRYTTYLDAGNKLKLTLLGTSHGGFLMSFLPYSVRDCLMLRVNNEEKDIVDVYEMKRFEKFILDFKTNILLLYVTSSSLDQLSELYN